MDDSKKYLQAALQSASNVASQAVFKAEQLIAAKDVAGCYSLDFISAMSLLPRNELFLIRMKLKDKFPKDFNLKEFDAQVKEAQRETQPKPEINGWHGKLISGEMGPKPLLANAMTAIRSAPEWKDVIAFDEFALRPVKLKPPPWVRNNSSWVSDMWGDTDSSRTAEWLQHNGVLVNSKVANEAVVTVAQENGFHPVREYLESLEWDRKPRIATWLTEYMKVEPSAYANAVGECWLIAAVKRIFEPGCQSDYSLIFEGKQGKGKSQALRALGGKWFTDNMDSVIGKDASMQICGVWIVEFSELNKHNRAEDAAIKAFLTRQTDRFRAPYGYHVQDIPRQCVFSGSVNPDSWLRDETGGRRFWPVKCGDVDVPMIRLHRDQLWAEAYSEYKNGTKPFITDEDVIKEAVAQQDQRYEGDAWDDIVLAWVANPIQRREGDRLLFPWAESSRKHVTVADVLLHGIGKPIDKWIQPDKTRIGKILSKAGWICRRPRENGDDGDHGVKRPRKWFPDEVPKDGTEQY